MYERALWCIYDMAFYGVSRLDTFRSIVRLGISRREAAQMIQDYEREP